MDESALRYFASQGDKRRVDAEIARLRALYPDWVPPSDLSQLSGTGGPAVLDPQMEQYWRLISEDRLSELRAEIAQRQSREPNWLPPTELLNALTLAEARRRLTNASSTGQWQTVLQIATDNPNLLTCQNVDAIWRVAEAFAKTDQMGRAKDAYVYVLGNCSNPAERSGTVQKALELLPESQVVDLLSYERKTGDQPDNFDSVRRELARRRVEKAAMDEKASATPEDLATVEAMAREANDPGTPIILGYYYYHHGSPDAALEWFKLALDRNGKEKAAEGYALTLRRMSRFVDAEAFAYDWREKTPLNLQVYLDIATALLSQDPPLRLEPNVIGRIVPVVTKERFTNGAQALGWYSYNTCQFPSARQWFEQALEWKPTDEPSAYGAALSSLRMNDRRRFLSIHAQWSSRSERIAALADDRKTDAEIRPVCKGQRRVSAYSAPQAAPAVQGAATSVRPVAEAAAGQRAMPAASSRPYVDATVTHATTGRRTTGRTSRGACVATRNPSGLTPEAALSLGWCLMEMNRPLEAVGAFDEAVRRGSVATREEAAYGKTLALLRKNMTANAAVAAAQAPQTASRQRELQASILSQRALSAFHAGRYTETILALGERSRIVPEQTDLMLLRGWAYLKLGRYTDAERIFRAVQLTGSPEASKGLNAVLEITTRVPQ